MHLLNETPWGPHFRFLVAFAPAKLETIASGKHSNMLRVTYRINSYAILWSSHWSNLGVNLCLTETMSICQQPKLRSLSTFIWRRHCHMYSSWRGRGTMCSVTCNSNLQLSPRSLIQHLKDWATALLNARSLIDMWLMMSTSSMPLHVAVVGRASWSYWSKS